MATYATLIEVKSHLSDSGVGTTYDTLLTALVERASRLVDRFTKRHDNAYYVSADSVRYFTGSGNSEQWIDELAAAPTTVAVAESGQVDNAGGTGGNYTSWAVSDYLLWPYNASSLVIPYMKLEIDLLYGTKAVWYRYPKSVKITGKWGYSTVIPLDITEATIIQTGRWFKRGQQGFMDMSAMQTLGRLQLKALDPEVQEMLAHWVRPVV